MKRTFATLGVVGLGLLSVTAPAIAAPERVIVCHSDGSSWAPLEFNINGLEGHDQHPLDIIPPTSKSPGKNWTEAGKLLYVDKCAALPPGETLPDVETPDEEPAEEEPVAETPVEEEPVVETPVVETPAVETPALTPAADQSAVVPPAAAAPGVAPQAAAPVAAAPRVTVQQPTAATGATSLETNQGYNAQTAVGGSDSAPSWLAGLGALAAAGAAVAVRRRSRAFTAAG